MYYILEAILVGIYSLLIFITLHFPVVLGLAKIGRVARIAEAVGLNTNITLFMVGFFKHLLGYLLNIHTYYCNNGDACLKYHQQLKARQIQDRQSKNSNGTILPTNDAKDEKRAKIAKVAKISTASLLFESVLEGCLFVILNVVLLNLKIKNIYLRIFILAIILHIIFEFLQLHLYF